MRSAIVWFVLGVAAAACTPGAPAPDPRLDSRVVEEPDAGPPDRCQRPAPLSGPMGPCSCIEDCALAGSLCGLEAEWGYPRGGCIKTCTDDSDCGEGARCATSRSPPVCIPQCRAPADCGPGRVCTNGDCVLFCQRDADCESGRCNAYEGRCVARDFVATGGGLGERCVADAECRSKQCLDGACEVFCSRTHQGCPEDAYCHGPNIYVDVGICYPRCTDDRDCRDPDASCIEVSDLGHTSHICL